jgi:hypothetical protein
MEVDWIDRNYYDWNCDQWADEHHEEEETAEVDHVGEMCRRCGGMGHYARECPTPKGKGKGKGKGGKGGGWPGHGEGKGKGKGKGKGGKGQFGGYCWQCGQQGHRATECRQNKEAENDKQMTIDAVAEDVHYEVGGVWHIAHVTAEDCPEAEWKTVKNNKGLEVYNVVQKGAGEKVMKTAAGKNRFEVLDVTDEECENQGDYEPRYVHTTSSTFIGTVAAAPRSRWRKTGSGEITVDSAAEESVCPKSWEEQYPMRRPSRWMRFVNASGGAMNHYGEKTATFTTGSGANVMSLGFQVSDVRKPLAAVWRIAEKGNKIQFGPDDQDNFIMNIATGSKVMMKRRGGSYVIPADFVVEEPGFHRPV